MSAPFRLKALVVCLVAASILLLTGCLQTVSTGGGPPAIRPKTEPIPEVFLDFDFAILALEIGDTFPKERVKVGELFGAVFTGSPKADYTLELVEHDLLRRLPDGPLLVTHVRYECEMTFRLKTVEGLERIITVRGDGRDARVERQELSVREAVCDAVEQLAEKVRYHLTP